MRCLAIGCTVIFLAFCVGCNDRSVGQDWNTSGAPDSAVVTDGALPDVEAPPDAEAGQDAAPPMTCADDHFYYEMQPAALDDLQLLSPDSAMAGQTVRLLATKTTDGCNRFAKVSVRTHYQLQEITLRGFVWQEQATTPYSCDPALETSHRVIPLPPDLPPGPWHVKELVGTQLGRQVFFTIQPCESTQDCFCTSAPSPASPAGEPCSFDCECGPSLRCLPHQGPNGWSSQCGQSCGVQNHCVGVDLCRMPTSSDAEPPHYVCEPRQDVHECTDASDCPEGHDCYAGDNNNRWCVPAFSVPTSLPSTTECCVQQDCPANLDCILSDSGATVCAARCTDNDDCPMLSVCDQGDYYSATGDSLPYCSVFTL